MIDIEQSKLQSLLDSAKPIINEEKERKKASKLRGECFNIFQILRMETDEEHTHSALLAELLNPKGSHGCGNKFLHLFLEQLQLKDPLDEASTKVEIEKNIGRIDDQYESGGRIDIFLTDKHNNAILIENKIYANDQYKQLYRYWNYAKKYEKFQLIYLTLDGHKPSDFSIEGNVKKLQDNDYLCVSYANEIKSWISDCMVEAIHLPQVQYTLTQYLKTINNLTNQNMDTKTQQELAELIATKENIYLAQSISSVMDRAYSEIMNKHLKKLLKEIAEETKLELCIKDNINWNNQYSQFHFKNEHWTNFMISFEFMGHNLSQFNYGFKFVTDAPKDDKIIETANELKSKLDCQYGPTGWWACYKSFPIQDWKSENTLNRIFDGSIKQEFLNAIKRCLEAAEGLQL